MISYSFARRASPVLFYHLLSSTTPRRKYHHSPFGNLAGFSDWRRYEPRNLVIPPLYRLCAWYFLFLGVMWGEEREWDPEGIRALIVMGIRLLAMSLVDMVGNSMGLTLWFAGQSTFHPLPPVQSLGPWSVYRRTNSTLD